MNSAAQFSEVAREYLDQLARRHPDVATELGDHRFDAHLPDASPDALADERRELAAYAARVEALDTEALSREQRVDAALLAGRIELRSHPRSAERISSFRAISPPMSVKHPPSSRVSTS